MLGCNSPARYQSHMTKSRYFAPNPGEWYPITRRHRASCCDCGLVHIFEIRKRKGRYEQRGWRSEAQTAGKRSALKRAKRGVFATK